jgi:tellurite methyltransferase
LNNNFDILFSSGVFHYIKPELREDILDNYRQFTNSNGLHIFNVFVIKPFIAPPPENEPTACKWISGELFTHYQDWLIHYSSEVIFDCNSSGIPHKHAMNKMIAQKIENPLDH